MAMASLTPRNNVKINWLLTSTGKFYAPCGNVPSATQLASNEASSFRNLNGRGGRASLGLLGPIARPAWIIIIQ